MSVVALIRQLLGAGMDLETVLLAAEGMESRSAAMMLPPDKILSNAAMRTRRYREKLKARSGEEPPSPTVTAASPVPSPTVTEGVTDRHRPSPPHARVVTSSLPSLRSEESKITPVNPSGLTAPEGAEWFGDAPKAKPRRGTRISAEWEPSPAERQMGLAEGLTEEEIDRVAREFKNFWLAQPSKNTKLDWPRTWQNRVATVAPRIVRDRENLAPRARWASGGGRGVEDFASIVARRRGFDQG